MSNSLTSETWVNTIIFCIEKLYQGKVSKKGIYIKIALMETNKCAYDIDAKLGSNWKWYDISISISVSS